MKEQYQYDETELACPHCEDDMTLLGIDHSDKQSFWNCPTCEQSYMIEFSELSEIKTQSFPFNP